MEEVRSMNDFWSGKNIFITGSGGFVGSWITNYLLENGSNVFSLIKKDHKINPVLDSLTKISSSLKIINGDITNYELILNILNKNEIDTCFHLAAQAIVMTANSTPIPTFETNIRGTWTILEALRNVSAIKRIVIASSDKAYGDQNQLPYTEQSPLNALHPYDASKACTDILARTFFRTYGLPITVTRCANIFGGGDMNFSRIIPDTIKSILNNRDPIIRSDGTPIRQYIYIKDVVKAYIILAENLGKENVKGEAFNFGSSKPLSVLELVKKIIEISGKINLKPNIVGKSRPKGEIDEQFLSSDKAHQILNWKPEFTLEQGLKETISWYKEEFEKGNELLKI